MPKKRLKKQEYRQLSVRLTAEEYDAFDKYCDFKNQYKSPLAKEILLKPVTRAGFLK